MNRIASGLCVAAAFSFAASLGAQTTTSSATSSMSHDKDIVVTGCLQRGADGHFMLTDAKMDHSAHRSTSTTGTTGSTADTSASSSAMGGTSATAESSWTLEGGQDLDKHVGHKIQVTGREGDSSRKDEMSTTSSGTSATGTTATTGTTGTSGSEMSSQHGDTSDAGQKLNVKSVKMISSSCS